MSLKIYSVFVLSLMMLCASAQVNVSRVEYNGAQQPQVNIAVTLPKQKPQNVTIQAGTNFPSGTLFQIPAYTTVYLKTVGGNDQRLGPGARHQVTATTKGEKHRTFFGKVKHWVSNKLDFYKASGPNKKYQGAVQGTEFTVEAIDHDVKFHTSEGSVMIQKQVPVQIKQTAAVQRKKDRQIYTIETSYVNAGDPEAFYDYDAYVKPISYNTYEEAYLNYQQKLDQGYFNGADPYYLADEYSLLGNLYMDGGRADLAIDPFYKALTLWYNIDPYDPFIYENYLDLAEAYYVAGYQDEGVKNWDIAVSILDQHYKFNLDEYNYFYSLQDYNTAWGFGKDLVEMYEGFGLAYEIRYSLGGEIEEYYQNPDYWYGQATDLEGILSQF